MFLWNNRKRIVDAKELLGMFTSYFAQVQIKWPEFNAKRELKHRNIHHIAVHAITNICCRAIAFFQLNLLVKFMTKPKVATKFIAIFFWEVDNWTLHFYTNPLQKRNFFECGGYAEFRHLMLVNDFNRGRSFWQRSNCISIAAWTTSIIKSCSLSSTTHFKRYAKALIWMFQHMVNKFRVEMAMLPVKLSRTSIPKWMGFFCPYFGKLYECAKDLAWFRDET